MAYHFDTTGHLEQLNFTPKWAGFPLTFACWFRQDTTHDGGIWSTLLNNVNFDGVYCGVSADNFYATSADNNVFDGSTNTTTLSDGVWYHGCGVFASTTSRIAYVNGSAGPDQTDSNSPVLTDTRHQTLGILRNTGDVNGFDGMIGEAAVWNAALTAADIATLAAGLKPSLMRPETLVHYWPCLTDLTGGSAEQTEDVQGNSTLIENNGEVALATSHPNMLTTPINITPNQATANHTTRSRPVFISHEDLGSPAAGDMMRLRVVRDYDHVSNTDDLQLHNVALWQKNADTA